MQYNKYANYKILQETKGKSLKVVVHQTGVDDAAGRCVGAAAVGLDQHLVYQVVSVGGAEPERAVFAPW